MKNSCFPREKLRVKGSQFLKDYELLAILLNTGYKGKNVLTLSKDILNKYTVSELFKLDLKQLEKIKGIGKAKSTLLLATFELARRVLEKKNPLNPPISKPADVLPLLRDIRGKKKEYFVGIYLNSCNQIICQEEISIGTLDASLVHPREVFEPAIQKGASGIILVHNHPSGNPHPSKQDIEVTLRIKQAGELMGIEIIDHLIISQQSFFSMKEENII